jgi:hypothetical protein
MRRTARRTLLWSFTPASYALSVTRDDRRLVVIVSDLAEGALTVATEGPRTTANETSLADHAHRIVAERTTLAAGKRRGERFARAWLRGTASVCGPAGATNDPPGSR